VVYLKQYFCRSTFDIINRLFHASRAKGAFNASLMLQQNGFETPAVIALFERRIGPLCTANSLLTEEVGNATSMAQLLRDMAEKCCEGTIANKRALVRAFADTVGRMHARNIFHGDLRLGNVLVVQEGREWRFFFIDNERTKKFHHLPARLRLKNLVQVSLFIHGITNTDRLRFFRAYRSFTTMQFAKLIDKQTKPSLINVSREQRAKMSKTDFTNKLYKPNRYFTSTREEMLKYIPAHVRTTLEFGCGFGAFSALLKNNFGTEAWAVEIDKTAAQEAAIRLDRVINADASESLEDIPENYFDCVILFDILEHLVAPYKLLCALKPKLTSEGVIVASIPNVRFYRNMVDLLIHGNWDYKDKGILDKTHLRFFTYKSIIKMFSQLGFEVLAVEGINPTSSRNYRLLNTLLFGRISDAKYAQYACLVRPIRNSESL
jgi:2-polyprenyl-3-methyl-5-hydroxy-6-metoxy-1,4-benzoquinol methylase